MPVAQDPHRLRPSELVALLNSTPLGPVIEEWQLRKHRLRAGTRVGAGKTVDLLRYAAWLADQRHRPELVPVDESLAIEIALLLEQLTQPNRE